MSVIATAVAALIEAGVTGDALVAAIARMEEAQAASQQPIRTLRQERNARYYQNRKARSAPSETSESVLNKTFETNSDEQKEGPHTPKKNTTPTNLSAGPKKNRSKRQKPEGILCPDDFRPSAAHYAKCAERNAPASVADAACTKMHRWSHEHADREIAWKANWSLALHNFLDGELDKHERQAAARASPSGQKPSSHGPLARLADRMGIPDDRSRQSHASTDYGTVIDHAGDGSADRDLFKPSGGFSGRSETPAYLSIVRAARG